MLPDVPGPPETISTVGSVKKRIPSRVAFMPGMCLADTTTASPGTAAMMRSIRLRVVLLLDVPHHIGVHLEPGIKEPER